MAISIGFVGLASSGGYSNGDNSTCASTYDVSAPSGGVCRCKDGKYVFAERPGGLLDCIDGVIELYSKYCVTSYMYNATETLVGGMCPYIQLQRYSNPKIYPDMDYARISAVSCGQANRTGTLCGRCDDDMSVAMTDSWSFRCVRKDECRPLNCFLYLLAELGPLTVMFAFVYAFGINVAAPYTFGYVTIAQIIPLYALNILRTVMTMPFAYNITKFLLSLYMMWSLDVFSLFVPPLCCVPNLSNMTVIAFKYIGAVYPLLLVSGSYLILKLHQWNVKPIIFVFWPIRACLQCMRIKMDSTSLLTTFCTFVSLAFVKLSIISLLLLSNERIYTASGELVGTVLLFDGTMAAWGPEHTPHAAMAVLVLVGFLFLPSLALTLYPLCNVQRRLDGQGRAARYAQYCTAVMEVFYGHFKDGTEGSRDYRFLGGVQLAFKFLLFFLILFGPTKMNEEPNYIVLQICTLLWALMILVLQPYKNQSHGKFEGAIMLYISMTLSVGTYTNINNDAKLAQFTFYALLFLPSLAVVVISGLVIIVPKLKHCSCCRRRAPRKASVPPKIIQTARSIELSERFIDDRLASYAAVPD